MQIGSLQLTPSFSYDVNEYEAITQNATDTITATLMESGATMTIEVNGTAHTNGEAATWVPGDNTVEITVERGTYTEVYTVTVYQPYDSSLSALTLGSLTLAPTFDDAELEYTAATTNATNTITATATEEDATIAITVNGSAHTNGAAATWADGENTVVITVTNHEEETVYTVIVTKS